MVTHSPETIDDLMQFIQSSIVGKIDIDKLLLDSTDQDTKELTSVWSHVHSSLFSTNCSETHRVPVRRVDDSLVNQLKRIQGNLRRRICSSDWKNGGDLNWRVLYAFASLMESLLLIISRESYCLETSLRCIDEALIMSPPICGNILATLGHKIHDSLVKIDHQGVSKEKCVENASSASGERPSIDLPAINANIQVESAPSLISFQDKYLSRNCPVVIKNVTSHWRACQLWSVNYFSRMFGLRWVPIEIGSNYLEDSWRQKIIQFDHFVDQYLSRSIDDRKSEIGYLAQYDLFHQVPLLRKDISLPDYCSLGNSMNNVQINVWIGPVGTISPLHTDPTDNLLTQIYGYKHIKLISSDAPQEVVYPHNASSKLSNTSCVDMKAVDISRFPRFHETRPFTYECILGPGDMLFIPKGWWHFVESLSSSCSISFWW